MTAFRALLFILIPTIGVAGAAGEDDPVAGVSDFQQICVPTHVGFFGDVTTVTLKQKGIVYRRGAGPWAKVPLELKGPHSIAQLPNGHWLISDTDNNRIVEIDDLSGNGKTVVRSELAGFALKRPHDEIVDPVTGDIYVIDGKRRLFRFKDLEGPVEVWEFTPKQLGYDRALSWFDGQLHVIHSSRGEVFRIDDFAKHRYTTFRSPRPADARGRSSQVQPSESYRDFDAGALASTGLILNDVEKYDNWYYGTNFFTPSFASGADTYPARLIRWKTWADFERGKWEDLSSYIPAGEVPLVPYFLSIRNGVLYTGLFDHDEPYFGPVDRTNPCKHDQIMRLDLSLIGKSRVHSKPTPSTAEHVRHPPLEGAPNFRDLGGYRTTDGRSVKWGLLYRSDALSDLTERDLQYLARLKIGKVVDFRSDAEVVADPDRLPAVSDIRREHLPIATDSSQWSEAQDAKAQLESIDRYLLTDMYPGFVRTATPVYRTWMQGLLDTPDSAQVFHCRGGADRTGFAAALFLLAVGVPKAAVTRDYLLSNQLLFSPEGRVFLDRRMETKLPAAMQLRPRYLEAAFAEMEKEYGSIEDYLRNGLGIDENFRRRLRDRYVE